MDTPSHREQTVLAPQRPLTSARRATTTGGAFSQRVCRTAPCSHAGSGGVMPLARLLSVVGRGHQSIRLLAVCLALQLLAQALVSSIHVEASLSITPVMTVLSLMGPGSCTRKRTTS